MRQIKKRKKKKTWGKRNKITNKQKITEWKNKKETQKKVKF